MVDAIDVVVLAVLVRISMCWAVQILQCVLVYLFYNNSANYETFQFMLSGKITLDLLNIHIVAVSHSHLLRNAVKLFHHDISP